ncbi:HVO_2922 family protein [Halorussus sp. AFM4]|uniref:HVO_2922 family protein n=1 Tax=Halorussus sp. AFM4 TaxID=3421651 RepID=UPI003EB74AEC
MTEEIAFESESTKTAADVATLFHHLGDCLGETSQLTFERDGETTTVAVPSELSVAVEVEREAGDDGSESTEVEIELEWKAGEAEPEPGDETERGSELAPVTESLDPGEAPRASLGRFEVYRDRADEWRWRLVHRNGNIIATSGEGYTSRRNAEKGLQSVMTNAPGATCVRKESSSWGSSPSSAPARNAGQVRSNPATAGRATSGVPGDSRTDRRLGAGEGTEEIGSPVYATSSFSPFSTLMRQGGEILL